MSTNTLAARVAALSAPPAFPRDLAQVLAVPGTVKPPNHDESAATLAAVTELREHGTGRASEDLQAAVLAGDLPAAERALQALAAARALAADGDAWAQLLHRVAQEQRRAYSTVAGANFAAVAEWYGQSAAKLAGACQTIDPAQDAAAILHAPARTRTAWETAAPLGEESAHRLETLATAARLAGKKLTSPLDLLTRGDDDGAQRRVIWAAWEDAGRRGGRLAALAVAGVVISPRELEDVSAYRAPLEYEWRRVRSEHGPGFTQRKWDPETQEWAD